MMTVLLVGLAAAAAGSFANNVISVWTGSGRFDLVRSSCMCGDRSLTVGELIPVVSCVVQKRTCLQCGTTIPVRYVLVEAAGIMIGIATYLMYGITVEGMLHFVFLMTLLMLGVIDYYRYILPNILVAILAVIALVRLVLYGDGILLNIGVAVMVGAVLLFFDMVYHAVRRRHAIGMGDVKLLSVVSLYYGGTITGIGIWAAAVMALVATIMLRGFVIDRYRHDKLPFGYYCMISFIILGFTGDGLIDYYVKVMGI